MQRPASSLHSWHDIRHKIEWKKIAEKLPRVAMTERAMFYYAATGATPHAAAALRRINALRETLFSKTLTNSRRTMITKRQFNIILNIITVQSYRACRLKILRFHSV